MRWRNISLNIARRYREEELELGEVVNFQIPVELDAGRRWLEAGQKLVSQPSLQFMIYFGDS